MGFIGLSETYFNRMIERFRAGLVKNITEFLSENWAMALHHEWFSEFRFNTKNKLALNEEVKEILKELTGVENAGFLGREKYTEAKKKVSEESKKMIRVLLSSSVV